MSEQTKKYLMRYWVMPLCVACLGYYWVAVLLAKVSSRFADPTPKDLLKMVLSRLADLASLDAIRVDFPAAFASNMIAATGQNDTALFLFHRFVEATPGTSMFSLFPFFFLVVFVGFGIRFSIKFSNRDAEEAAKNQKHLRGTRRIDAAAFCKKSGRNLQVMSRKMWSKVLYCNINWKGISIYKKVHLFVKKSRKVRGIIYGESF